VSVQRDCTRQRTFFHRPQKLSTESLCLRDNHRDRVRKERMRVRNFTRGRGLAYTNAHLYVSLYRAQMLPTHSLGLCVNHHTRVSGTCTLQQRRRIAPMSNSCKDTIHSFPEQQYILKQYWVFFTLILFIYYAQYCFLSILLFVYVVTILLIVYIEKTLLLRNIDVILILHWFIPIL
jgi:hypothetical protein